jgi:hypothetical protein
MQLTLIRAGLAQARPQPTPDLTRIVRPWALLAGLVAAYSAYTAFDGLPGLLQHANRAAVPASLQVPAAQPEAATAPAARLLMVTRCDEEDGTRYTDGACSPGIEGRPFLVATDANAQVRHQLAGPVTQVCADIAHDVQRIADKATHAPSESERHWLELRHHEARVEQLRLGC